MTGVLRLLRLLPPEASLMIAERRKLFFSRLLSFEGINLLLVRDSRELQEKAFPNMTQHMQQSPAIFQPRWHTSMDC